MTAPSATDTAKPVLQVRDIVKTYGGVTALDGVSFDLYPGEVHCLAGENGCGKSTLIKIISGAERPDAGEIVIDDVAHRFMNATAAITSGIQVIYQDFSLFGNLTVAENIALTSAVAERRRLYSPSDAKQTAKRIVDELRLNLDLDADVAALTVADRQLTAICRAVVHEARVIIMDEPTTALTHSEVDRLFALVDTLRSRGVGLVFVSHKLDEVLRVAQRVTILRSGRQVVTGPTSEFTRQSISEWMTGRELSEERVVSALPATAPVVLDVEGLNRPGAFTDVSFTVRAGEILGVTGLLGSGRTEIAEALFGVRPASSGIVKLDGKPVTLRSIQDAIAAGIGYVPEDRLTQGLFMDRAIGDNIIAGSLDRYRTRWRTLDNAKTRATIRELFDRLRIKAPRVAAPVRSLSGGNAQRVVLAKWLAIKPRVLILNGPTVGVDVGSKADILEILRSEAAEGRAIIVISDDVPELVAACHRVVVVRQGRITHTLEDDDVNSDLILERIAA
ncbi:sugar ABC transporter ATP-binding protein [Mycobacterium sp. 3519A]|jgi:simple sugar transport system ATP-binding protein|uniref:sugar ABC transporter ATP-binding protein n=1 Tax=Mycobacterium sp. 3519A TaxID=2057184 RepID=UPI000C7C348E|nr:sugar ABC transporter ATP-binding protein [Mycobacterium sp. 3519A]